MTTLEAMIAFTLAAGLVTLTPGLDTALVLRTAAVEGGRRAFLAGAGICTGCLTWGLVAALGLGAVLAASEIAYMVLRWAGAGYLFYLGMCMILSARSHMESADAYGGIMSGALPKGWFIRGFVTNILNPKIGVFYVTFLPQFVPAGVDVLSFSVLLAAIHALLGILWFCVLIVATQPLAALIRHPFTVRTLDRVTGGVLIAFGLKLILDARRS